MLNTILKHKKEEILQIKMPNDENIQNRSFFQALKNSNREVGLIAEVKKASPSKGLIKENFQPVQIAKEYEKGLADCLSVLTDERFFQGNRDYLTKVKKAVQIPVLRKDFIIEDIQVLESKKIGADAILLIGEALEPSKLYELYLSAYEKGMDVLVEVHSYETLSNLLALFTPKIIGVNNRDLTTFKTDIRQLQHCVEIIPNESIVVSESGIHTYDDLQVVKKDGAEAILVGESLMRKESQENAIYELFGETSHAKTTS
ncbi:indole-3-glycerol phosphate synthase TrpC [Metabacillus arenae]|nr:indole-3-glycerol phosphate synthase TrpC [Metabacillus arenae]